MRLPPRLIALTPGTGLVPAALLLQAGRAIEAGLRGVLLREPEWTDKQVFETAQALSVQLETVDGWLAIHDRVYLAREAGAHAVHLGFRSLGASDVRSLIPSDMAIGRSSHAGDDLSAEEVDYRFFGPVWPTPSKEGLLEATGVDALNQAAEASAAPVYAIGGLTPQRAAKVASAGICVRGALLASPDPKGATQAFLEALA